MATFDAFVIEGLDEAKRITDPDLWWDALERALPDAVEPVVHDMAILAPKRSGKLASGMRAVIRRVSQGFIRGVEVLLGSGEPYGHLVDQGHNIIARGPARSGLTRTRRAALRSGLLERRSAGPIGFVQPKPFAQPAVLGQQDAVLLRIESAMRERLRLAA